MLVEVRAIERDKWHGKKGSENFTQPMKLECLYDKSTGKYATGLSEEERIKLEADTGYDLSDAYSEKPHPFWSSATAVIKLPVTTTIFDTEKPLDLIKVKVLKASKYVANSMKEYQEGMFPEATHVIFDEVEEMEIKASKIQKKRKATQLAIIMTADEKANVIQILSNKSMRNQSQDFLDVEIDRIIEEDVVMFIQIAKADKSETYIKAAILEGIHRNILTKEGNIILYMGDRIGHNLEEAVKYFADPDNQIIKASMLEKMTFTTPKAIPKVEIPEFEPEPDAPYGNEHLTKSEPEEVEVKEKPKAAKKPRRPAKPKEE